MKVLSLALAVLFTSTLATAQVTTPQLASPRGMVGCTIGVTEITIDYGRPSAKDREIWGTLVPYDEV